MGELVIDDVTQVNLGQAGQQFVGGVPSLPVPRQANRVPLGDHGVHRPTVVKPGYRFQGAADELQVLKQLIIIGIVEEGKLLVNKICLGQLPLLH